MRSKFPLRSMRGMKLTHAEVDPHTVTMDLLTIASLDVNRPLLKTSIPVLIKAWRLRGEKNQKMVTDVMNIFIQLSFDSDCMAVLQANAIELTKYLKLVIPPKYDLQSCLASHCLQELLQDQLARAQPKAKSRFEFRFI